MLAGDTRSLSITGGGTLPTTRCPASADSFRDVGVGLSTNQRSVNSKARFL